MKEHPIPRDGAWDDVSGESFLRLLLSMPIEHASYNTVSLHVTGLEMRYPSCHSSQTCTPHVHFLIQGPFNLRIEINSSTRSKMPYYTRNALQISLRDRCCFWSCCRLRTGPCCYYTYVNEDQMRGLHLQGRSSVYSTNRGCGVDPRNIAQRIMEVRSRQILSLHTLCKIVTL